MSDALFAVVERATGRIVGKPHSTREAARIEAVEAGLVLRSRGRLELAATHQLVELPGNAAAGSAPNNAPSPDPFCMQHAIRQRANPQKS